MTAMAPFPSRVRAGSIGSSTGWLTGQRVRGNPVPELTM